MFKHKFGETTSEMISELDVSEVTFKHKFAKWLWSK